MLMTSPDKSNASVHGNPVLCELHQARGHLPAMQDDNKSLAQCGVNRNSRILVTGRGAEAASSVAQEAARQVCGCMQDVHWCSPYIPTFYATSLPNGVLSNAFQLWIAVSLGWALGSLRLWSG